MDMEGRNGDRRPWSRYRDHPATGSSSSTGYTSAGTIVSTGYTSSSSSRLSSISLGLEAAAIHLESFDGCDRSLSTWFVRPPPPKKSRKEIDEEEKMRLQETAKKKMKGIETLVQEFLNGRGGDISAIDWWLKHLGVDWVLDITDDIDATTGILLSHNQERSWIRVLAKITQTIRFRASLCPDHGSMGLPTTCAQEEKQPEIETGNRDSIPDLFQFAQFIHGAMLKLLFFVDVIVAPNAKFALKEQQVTVMNRRVLQLYHKLSTILSMHGALSEALSAIQWLFRSEHSKEVERMQDKIVGIWSQKVAKVAEAIWSTMEQIRMDFIDDHDDSSCSLNTLGSSDIHKTTSFVKTYIRLLCSHFWSVAAIVSESASLGKYVPQTGNVRPLDSMIGEIVSCLQEKLANISESFLDHGLRSLFLLNNSYSIQEVCRHRPFSHQVIVAPLFGKVKGYMESYLQVSWAPVLSCLLNPALLCFGRNYSLLPKFESEFQKTYTTQKMWKVPDPELRRTLRKAIIEKIIPGYTKYIEDNKITNPKFRPQELKGMLQELFEG